MVNNAAIIDLAFLWPIFCHPGALVGCRNCCRIDWWEIQVGVDGKIASLVDDDISYIVDDSLGPAVAVWSVDPVSGCYRGCCRPPLCFSRYVSARWVLASLFLLQNQAGVATDDDA